MIRSRIYLHSLMVAGALLAMQGASGQEPKPVVAATHGELDSKRVYIRMRLLDQHDRPLESRSYQFSNTGKDEQIGAGAEGLVTLSFEPRRPNKAIRPLLFVSDADLETKEVTLDVKPKPGELTDAGVVRTRRFDPSESRPAKVRVVDSAGGIVPAAKVVANPKATVIHPDAVQRIMTDESGEATIEVFPTKYYVFAVHEAFLVRKAETFDFGMLNPEDGITVTLQRVPNYCVDVEWIEFDGKTNKPAQKGTFQLTTQQGQVVPLPEKPSWIDALQLNDRVGLQFNVPRRRNALREEGMTIRNVDPPGNHEEFFHTLKLDEPIEACPHIKMPNWTLPPKAAASQEWPLTGRADDIVLGVLDFSASGTTTNYVRLKAYVRVVE